MTTADNFPTITLGEVVKKLENDSSLNIQTKADLTSAIKKGAAWISLDGLNRPADPGFIAEQLRKISPAMAGLSKASMANLRSRIRRALRLVGISVHPGKQTNPLSGEWLAAITALGSRRQRRDLSRFAHFAAARNWRPSEIEARHFEVFEKALMDSAIHRAPRNAVYRLIKTWNYLAAADAQWPGKPVAQERRRKPYVLKMDVLPETLQRQIAAHFELRSNPPPFSFNQIASIHSPSPRLDNRPRFSRRSNVSLFARRLRTIAVSTVQGQKYSLLQFISALVATGMSAQDMTSLATILERDLIERGLTFFYERAGNRMIPQIRQIGWTLVGIAKYTLKDEELAADIRALLQNVNLGTPREMSRKVQSLLRQFDNPRNRMALLNLPARLAKMATSVESKSMLKAARLYGSALAIEFLINIPTLRIGNLAALHIDNNFLPSHGLTHVLIPAEQVKNHQAIEAELEAGSQIDRMFKTFVSKYRPHLSGAQSRWLFPNDDGGHLPAKALSQRIPKIIFRYTGLRMTVHMFRHHAAEMYLDEAPNGYETVRQLLGHRSSETAARFYVRRNQTKALRRYVDSVLKVRHESLRWRLPKKLRGATDKKTHDGKDKR